MWNLIVMPDDTLALYVAKSFPGILWAHVQQAGLNMSNNN